VVEEPRARPEAEPVPAFLGAPPAARGRDLVSVEELEGWLGRAGGRALPAGEERALRAVLGRWDFADAEGWRPLLARLSPAGGPLGLLGERREVQRRLERFAASEVRGQLAAATVCRREVDYGLSLGEELPGVSGRIDVLWQDGQGRWHLLLYDFEAAPAGAQEACWQAYHVRLVLAARALQEQVGNWPRGVSLALLDVGEVLTRPGGRLAHRTVLRAVAEGLAALARQPVEGSA
jgi:hypothetical protein